MPIYIEGAFPIQGTVKLSGAKNSAMKLIFASMFANEDVVLDNVPRVSAIMADLEIIKSLGAKAEWIGTNKLLLNGSTLDKFEIPAELGSNYRATFLLAGPLLFRFGKAVFPKYKSDVYRPSPVNRILSTWKQLGIVIEETPDKLVLTLDKPKSADVNFRTPSHTGTDNAILTALFIQGETIVNNASEEPEVDDLINFCNGMGADVERLDPKRIKVTGTGVFRGTGYTVMADKFEAALLATAAVITRGNIVIKGIERTAMSPFINFLSRLNINYEISSTELKIWNITEELLPLTLTVAPSPGYVPDWAPLAVLVLANARGESLVNDTVYVDRYSYIKDLNRMGADIELITQHEAGLPLSVSDDAYDIEAWGEPATVARIKGPSDLKGEKIHVSDPRYAYVFVLAALMAVGRTEIHEYKPEYEPSENFFDKLINLGAKIKWTT